MKSWLTNILSVGGNIFGYVFWLGGTLWFLKRGFEMHREVDKESADALRVPRWFGWLLTGKKNITIVSFLGVMGPFLAIFWFAFAAMMIGYIVNIWMYYTFWLSVSVMAIWLVIYFTHLLVWWWKHR